METEMARTKTPAAARSAAHAAPAPDAAPGAAAAPGSPAAAVCAALAASPGATTAVIADAAGIGRPAAREALAAMEKAGTATRVRGGKPGIPDTWTLAGAAPPGAGPAPEPVDEQDCQPGDSPGGTGQDEAAGGTGQDGEAVPHSDAPQGSDDGAVPHEAAALADGDGEASGAPDPAVVMEITGRIAQVKAAADAAATVLAGGGDLRAALAGLDEACEQAVQARRELKAAIGGPKAPAARPGGLRDKVLAHLDAHPGGEFTPHEIHKVLGNSSGAIANALDTLVKLGDAELATEKPRRFRRLAGPAAPGTPGTDAADSTGLAGAA
jgi:hypothetical protein